MIYTGNSLEILPTLKAQSIHCCVTSPPYFGLRSYSGGAAEIGAEKRMDCLGWATGAKCGECFICTLTSVFGGAEGNDGVWRVLKDDGTLWVNLGDSYIAKNLCMVPHRFALAMQSAGWYVRNDIVWAKPSTMPESVTDRCTRAHEFIFHFSKSEKYYYNADAIKEKRVRGDPSPPQGSRGTIGHANSGLRKQDKTGVNEHISTRETCNKRSVWIVSRNTCKEAHFATYPPALITPCIRAGCPVGGIVLDPFTGSGTTGMVAAQEGREFVGIELNPEYAALAVRRINGVTPAMQEMLID